MMFRHRSNRTKLSFVIRDLAQRLAVRYSASTPPSGAARHLERTPPRWAGAVCFCAGAGVALAVMWMLGAPAWAELVVHLLDRGAGIATVGLMTMACVMATRTTRSTPESRDVVATGQQLWQIAKTSSLIWLVAACGHLVTQHQARADNRPERTLTMYAIQEWQGRLLMLQIVLVAVVVVAAAVTYPWPAQGVLPMAMVLTLALAAVCVSAWAPAETSALSRRVLLLGHVLPGTLWVGGLFATAVAATRVTPDWRRLPEIVLIYSEIALTASVCVAITGLALLGGWIEKYGWDSLLNDGDGPLRVAKTFLLVVLMAAGGSHRKFTITKLETTGDARLLIWLGLGELVVMGVAIALGVTLADNAFALPPGDG